jgi:hypothetical protein
MDFATFKDSVDQSPDGITLIQNDPQALYQYAGLPDGSHYRRIDVAKALIDKAVACFTTGKGSLWQRCRELATELIFANVLDGTEIEPYLSILERLRDGARGDAKPGEDIQGDWAEAIRHTYDAIRLDGLSFGTRMGTYAREYSVAYAAKHLQSEGYKLTRSGAQLGLEPDSEKALIGELERHIKKLGGLNVAEKIFKDLVWAYDKNQQRYHIVPSAIAMGQPEPQIPYGYLLHLAIKHAAAGGVGNIRQNDWDELHALAKSYASVLDVQSYGPLVWGSWDGFGLLKYLRERALSDTPFRIPQMRANDVVRLCKGLFDGMDLSHDYGGWNIAQALSFIEAMLGKSDTHRGPIRFWKHTIGGPVVPLAVRVKLLDNVFCHPAAGANQNFSHPQDAPIRTRPGREVAGHDFFQRPLIRGPGTQISLVDRSLAGIGCIEALCWQLRRTHKNLDDRQLGPAIERFLRAELFAHNIPAISGYYRVGDIAGECDLVVETPQTIIFFEIKKKALTRQASSGSEAHVLVDLARSLVVAQTQAGQHELLLRKQGYLELFPEQPALGRVRARSLTKSCRLDRRGREIERIAVSLHDYGGFQDRMFLEKFMFAGLTSRFSTPDPEIDEALKELNQSLDELNAQENALASLRRPNSRSFFNCWFLSAPQLLILLDKVTSPDDFKKELWSTRHYTLSTSDFYYELDYARRGMKPRVRPGSTSATTLHTWPVFRRG